MMHGQKNIKIYQFVPLFRFHGILCVL